MNIYVRHRIARPAKEARPGGQRLTGCENHGITELRRKVYWNLPTRALYEEADASAARARVAAPGPAASSAPASTPARSAADKYIVREQTTEETGLVGRVQPALQPPNFNALLSRMQGFFQGRDVFVQDCYAGADPENRLPDPHHHREGLASASSPAPCSSSRAAWTPTRSTCPSSPSSARRPSRPTRWSTARARETFIIANFSARLALIGGSAYGGEIKKTIFTVLNFLLPLEACMPMHCSANVGPDGDVALFFGLSGTGKTTLSADPTRRLIGDDEHGWNDNGIFNFEDGCYAKVIRLSPQAEPQIYACTRRFGTILENVVDGPAHAPARSERRRRITENTARRLSAALHRQLRCRRRWAGIRRTSSS